MALNPLKWFRKKSPEDKQRKALKKARRQSARRNKILVLTPPEGVPLNLRLATIGERAGAQLADFLLTLISVVILIVLTVYAVGGSGTTLTVAATLLMFFIRVPYYIVTELVWNGRTVAKRWMGLRVISVDGRSLTAHQVVVRNIMKEIEFFAPLTFLIAGSQISPWIFSAAILWTIILLVVPWRSKLNQRFGDLIANTAVISDPKPVLSMDMASRSQTATSEREERFPFATAQLDHYGKFELQVLERVLRSGRIATKSSKENDKHRHEIVQRITAKIGYPEKIPLAEEQVFLEAFYRAQRAHLESRRLFGDAREDKFFADDKVAEKEHAE